MSGEECNAELACSEAGTTMETTYNSKDAIIYALGVGSDDLRYTYELDDDFSVLPTYPVVLAFKGTETDVISFPPPAMIKHTPGLPPVNPAMILHGEQYLEVLKPLPTEGTFKMHAKTVGLHDKGKGALHEVESVMYDSNGDAIVRLVMGSFYRGLCGFKSAGKTYSAPCKPPARAPDAVEEQSTATNQAMIYRLSGDYNPLHADPEMATSVGFKKPILHGLCSFGYAARHVLKAFANNDASAFRAIKVRFASPVYPGETLVTSMWKEGNKIIFETKVKERDVVVINNSYVELNPSAKM